MAFLLSDSGLRRHAADAALTEGDMCAAPSGMVFTVLVGVSEAHSFLHGCRVKARLPVSPASPQAWWRSPTDAETGEGVETTSPAPSVHRLPREKDLDLHVMFICKMRRSSSYPAASEVCARWLGETRLSTFDRRRVSGFTSLEIFGGLRNSAASRTLAFLEPRFTRAGFRIRAWSAWTHM